jgi:hypothetical protein
MSSLEPGSFEPGRIIMHRNVHRDRVAWVRPARVISDDERGLLVWVAQESSVAYEVAADGRGIRSMPFAEWVTLSYKLHVDTWAGPGVLKFLPTGAAHSVWWFRELATETGQQGRELATGTGQQGRGVEDGRFSGWYVNLEESGVRWDDGDVAGVDIVDQDLDIWVPPDRRWRWKDEDEFAERLDFPEHYWVPDEAAVWAEGERVVKIIDAGEFPFDGTWVDFQPDPDWSVPRVLPPGWDRPSAR